jgi:hypothetical protein
MYYPTLFELLKPKQLANYYEAKLEYPSIAENLFNALTTKNFVGQLSLNDCTNICACCDVSYLFNYSTIHDCFYTYKIIDGKAVIDITKPAK